MYREQKLVFDHIEQLIERPTPKDEKVIFINGQAGSGKSFVLQAIDSYIRGKRLNIINMSNVGVAAMILRDGRTVHNVFKLPVPVHYDSLARIMPGTKAWNEIKNTDVFIWDEAPNAPKQYFHVVNKKNARNHEKQRPIWWQNIHICRRLQTNSTYQRKSK